MISVVVLILAASPADFATAFDAGKGLEVSGTGGLLGLQGSGTISASLRLRGERGSRSKRGTTWFNDHRLAHVETRPDDRAIFLTAYEGLLRRHVDEGFVLLPFSPPVKLPFPFDFGLALSAARYERIVNEGWSLETARVTLFLDAVRSPTARYHFGLGPTLAHTMRGGNGAALTHELMPLTGLQGLASLESENGLWVLRAEGVAGWSFSPGVNNAATFRARGEIVAERVLIAVNDQPVAVTLRGTGAWADRGGRARSEITVQAGLTVRFFSAQ